VSGGLECCFERVLRIGDKDVHDCWGRRPPTVWANSLEGEVAIRPTRGYREAEDVVLVGIRRVRDSLPQDTHGDLVLDAAEESPVRPLLIPLGRVGIL